MIARALPAEGRLVSVGDTVLDLYALDGSDSSTRHLLHPRADCNVEEGKRDPGRRRRAGLREIGPLMDDEEDDRELIVIGKILYPPTVVEVLSFRL